MNIELVKEWIAALRSGKYKQGTGRLEDTTEGTFCCLGVAAKIAVDHGLANRFETAGVGHYRTDKGGYVEDEDYTHLPPSLKPLFGISDFQQSQLIDMNDEEGNSFLEISDYIEINILKEKA
jgi:hypothetical protein